MGWIQLIWIHLITLRATVAAAATRSASPAHHVGDISLAHNSEHITRLGPCNRTWGRPSEFPDNHSSSRSMEQNLTHSIIIAGSCRQCRDHEVVHGALNRGQP